MAYLFLWCCVACVLAPLVGSAIRKMGADETLPPGPNLTLIRR